MKLEELKDTKEKLGKKLGSPPWLVNISVALDEHDRFYLHVQVNDISPEVLDKIPPFVDDVRVITSEIGKI